MGGETAPVTSSGSAPAWTASVSNASSRSPSSGPASSCSASSRAADSVLGASGSVAIGGLLRRPTIAFENELLAVDVVDLDADLLEAELADHAKRWVVCRRYRGAETFDAVRMRP